MTTYYKAVHPDGTSFHDSRFRWLPESGPVEGHMVTHPTASIIGRYASQYLSVSVSPTDCSGMWWPLRLLEVEPVGNVVTPEPKTLPNKRAGVAFKVVRELPATDALGPQGMHVAALIEHSEQLTLGDTQKLAAANNATDHPTWTHAIAAMWRANVTNDAGRAAARDAAMIAAKDAGDYAAGRAAGDAAMALVVRDLVAREYYDTLTLPWRTIIGPIHPDDDL